MKTLCVLLIEDDPDYAALVQRWLSPDTKAPEFVLNWTDSLAAALTRLDQGGVDLILMDLGLPDSKDFKTFASVRAKAPDLPIVILSGGDDEALALETIQQGAQDYLIKLTCQPEMLVRTLRHTIVRHRSMPRDGVSKEKSRARVIGIIGASGGAGVTTIASVLAAELRFQTEQNTLLMDLDLSPGLVAFTTGVEPQYSVHDAMDNADRLDKSIWDGIITQRSGNLDILAASPAKAASDFDLDRTRQLLDFAGSIYQWVVMDLGRLNHFSKKVAGWADEVILVTGPAIPALHQCKHAVELLEGLGIDRERIRLILNRKETVHRLSPKEIQKLFGIEIDAVLRPSHDDLYQACLQKRLPAVTSDFREALTALARKLAGLPDLRPSVLMRPLVSITEKLRHFGEATSKAAAS
jgi:Flp pilus assembly CpaE family ATPase